jgi:hypothetical protein
VAEQTRKSSKPQTRPPQTSTQQIPASQWITFLTEFTSENRGAHARLEVLGPDIGYQVQTDNRPFDGVAADLKDGEHAVWISFGSTGENHFTHGIQNVRAIRVRLPAGQSGTALEVAAEDGTRTLLELSATDAYALPSGAR